MSFDRLDPIYVTNSGLYDTDIVKEIDSRIIRTVFPLLGI